MAVITRGFGGRRRDDTDLPPGQYRTDDFSLVLLGRRHRLAPSLSALSEDTKAMAPAARIAPCRHATAPPPRGTAGTAWARPVIRRDPASA